MRKQNVPQRKFLHLYSIHISKTPKTSSCSMWSIFKWKSKAKEHEEGRRKILLTGREPSSPNSEITSCVPGSTLATIMGKDIQKLWSLPFGGSWYAHWNLAQQSSTRIPRRSQQGSTHTGLFSPLSPPGPRLPSAQPHGLPVGQQACVLDVCFTNELNPSNICSTPTKHQGQL